MIQLLYHGYDILMIIIIVRCHPYIQKFHRHRDIKIYRPQLAKIDFIIVS